MRQSESRQLQLRGAIGELRTEQFDGREHLVLPIVALVEGVIWPINAPHPEFVPAETLSFIPAGWNGRPVFADIGHPVNDAGSTISGNSPAVLEHAIGKIFNAKTDGKRLLMEAWLDTAKPEAAAVIARVRASEAVEVSVGAFVVSEATKGNFAGKNYDAIWREVVPDHLALLPSGDEGACSVKMGCGIRAAHLITAEGIVYEITKDNLARHFEHPESLKTLVSFTDGVVVYEEADGKFYRQAYASETDGIKLGERVEVKPVTYYEPIDVTAAKGARHSASDMTRVQAMHDSAVELGAQCSPKAMAAKPCGCHTLKEQNMTKEKREALTKALKAGVKPEAWTAFEVLAAKSKSDILDAILSQIKDKFGLSDTAAADLSNLAESTLVELAGMSMPAAEPEKPAAPGGDPALAGAKAKTEAEWMAEAPAPVKALVARAQAQDKARRVQLVTAIKAATKEYTDAELDAESTDSLEKLSRACAAKAPEIDFSGQAPREGDQEETVAPPPDMGAAIRAARGIKS